jgi:aryl-alcohol dehydrogenase-like predicted oxidoreductase
MMVTLTWHGGKLRTMLYKNLGSTNLNISAIGQGATHVGSYDWHDDIKMKERIKGWRIGIDLGMNFIDTADLYGGGLSEELVGQTIKGIRHDVVLATKFNPNIKDTYSSIIRSAEESLLRLNTDYIDLYQVHFPNPFIPIEQMVAALTRLVTDGKVRYVGLSNYSIDDLQQMEELFSPGIMSNQVEYSINERSSGNEMLPYCQQRDITIIAYSPLGQGNLSLRSSSLQTLKTIADKYHKSIFQVALRWIISKPQVIAVMKAADIEHIKENAESADFVIDPDDLASIDNLAMPEVVNVPVDRIFVESPDGRPCYTSLDAAIKNEADLIPSPELLAADIIRRKSAKPIGLIGYIDPYGKYQYKFDPYDFLGQLRKYWAWVIAYGNNREIPARIKKLKEL